MLFFNISLTRPHQHCSAYYWFYYAISDVAENLGKHLSGAQCIAQGKDFEVILTVP